MVTLAGICACGSTVVLSENGQAEGDGGAGATDGETGDAPGCDSCDAVTAIAAPYSFLQGGSTATVSGGTSDPDKQLVRIADATGLVCEDTWWWLGSDPYTSIHFDLPAAMDEPGAVATLGQLAGWLHYPDGRATRADHVQADLVEVEVREAEADRLVIEVSGLPGPHAVLNGSHEVIRCGAD